ncbi:MAG TPA: hypothetical protein VM925_03710, partial [Labilithrix sp.]|nr:hypothetical protein [Labilithrix sp.]
SCVRLTEGILLPSSDRSRELGYPTSDEYAVSEKRKSDFQKGSISWDPSTNRTTVKINSAN